jgi:hypothetical protein
MHDADYTQPHPPTALSICVSFASALAGFSPVSAATRHVVLFYDERVELPGLSSLDAEFVRTLQSKSGDPRANP